MNFTASFRELVEVIGFEATEKLARRMGGQAVYIPKMDSLEKIERNEQIARAFDGSNYAALARQYNLSERRVRCILDSMRNMPVQEHPTHTLSIEDFLPEED